VGAMSIWELLLFSVQTIQLYSKFTSRFIYHFIVFKIAKKRPFEEPRWLYGGFFNSQGGYKVAFWSSS